MMKQWKRSSYTKINRKIQNNFKIINLSLLYLIFRRRKVTKFKLKIHLLGKLLE